MPDAVYVAPQLPLRERLARQGRILRVLAKTDFKFKYAGSVVGYVWSLAKPLLYFAVLWIVFGNLFETTIDHFALYLILGIVLWTFVADAVTATYPSLVSRGAILRRIAFPAVVIPVAATVTALMSFGLNLVAVAVFIAGNRIEPNPKWILLAPLLLELYLFAFALSLIAATFYVRFRDVGQIWEVGATVLFFSAPIIYPVTLLPEWVGDIVAFNPFVQILQDVRRVILGPDAHAVQLLGPYGSHVAPLAVLGALLAIAAWAYRRESPRFAEIA